MSNWINGKLTAAGRVIQAKVEAGARLKLTSLKLGDGAYSDYTSTQEADELTDLKSPKATFGISTVSQKNDECTVSGVFATSSNENVFFARELGLFAADPDTDEEILYMVALDGDPDYVPPKASSLEVSVTYALKIAIANIDHIVVNIDPTGLTDVEMMNRAARIVQRGMEYKRGEILYHTDMPTDLELWCKVGGTTSDELVDFSTAYAGQEVQDGEVMWLVCKRMVGVDGNLFCLDEEGDIMPVDIEESEGNE